MTILKVVYLYRSDHEREAISVPPTYAVALVACVVLILVMGAFSAPWFDWAMTTAGSLF
jgi:NADH:ubiquinone oxidoreductase subunit 2 (subunit N)